MQKSLVVPGGRTSAPLSQRELRWIGIELHEQLAQELAGISLLAGSILSRLPGAATSLHSDVSQLSEVLATSIARCRSLASAIAPSIYGASGVHLSHPSRLALQTERIPLALDLECYLPQRFGSQQ